MNNVLHLGTEMSWRGGENQIRYLMQGLPKGAWRNHLAYPNGSQAVSRMSEHFPTLVLKSKHAWRPSVVSQLVKYCTENKIDLIDAHSSGGHSLGLAVKKRLPALKLVVHRRVDNPVKRGFFSRRKYLSPLVDRYVAISGAIGQILIDYGIPDAKISVVKSATDGSRFSTPAVVDRQVFHHRLTERLGLKQETLLIGNASALTSQKGYEVLIEALSLLRLPSPLSFHCVIAGDGILRGALEKQVRELKLEKKVSFLGFIQDVDSLLSGLDILCVPSNNEGLGTILLDGIHAGCVIVATRVGGIPEIVLNGQTGLISEKGDARALASNLEKVCRSPELRAQLSQQAKVRIESEFSLQKMVDGNRLIYENLLHIPTDHSWQ
jgi:glycosyltransferase involved in cell wall biosynthesis